LNIHLLFVGSGELDAELRANCNVVFDQENSILTSDLSSLTSGTRPRASFAGFLNQTEVSDAYVAADVLVLPSESETWGLVVNEAMASGLPAVISDAVGCAPDLIVHGDTGFTFPACDARALATRLVEIAGMLKNRGRLASACQEKVQNYSVDAAVLGTLEAVRYVRQDGSSRVL